MLWDEMVAESTLLDFGIMNGVARDCKGTLWVAVHWDLVKHIAEVRELSSPPIDVSIESRHGYILSFWWWQWCTILLHWLYPFVTKQDLLRITVPSASSLFFQIHLIPMLCRRVILVIISHVSRIQIACRRLSNVRNELSRCKRIKERLKNASGSCSAVCGTD